MKKPELMLVRYEDNGIIGDGQVAVSEHCLECKHLDRKWYSICPAFPDGIPLEIVNGENNHLNVIKGQKNSIVFEKENKAV